MSNYCLSSKKPYGDQGKKVLMSFARIPIWKTFEEILRQDDTLPNCYNKTEMNYALKKYANKENYKVVSIEDLQKELNDFKKQKHH